ncbi:Transcriptional activator DEMETER [Linum grandiflorum]
MLRITFRSKFQFYSLYIVFSGDRRFSKWKGSVVDSVIGAFLTPQNVADHLSSSAFMSLAARFPLKSMKNQSCSKRKSVVIEEPDDCIQNPERLFSLQDSFGSSIITRGNDGLCKKLLDLERFLFDEETTDEHSGQVDAGYTQLRASLERSERSINHEDQTLPVPSSSNLPLLENLPRENCTFFQELFNLGRIPSDEATKDINSAIVDAENVQLGMSLERSEPVEGTSPYNKNLSFRMPSIPSRTYGSLRKEVSASEGSELKNKPGEELATQHSSETQSISAKDIHMKNVKAGKRKTHKEKNNAVDWDILRKQVLQNGRSNERSKDNMDSLDYDALKNATVDEISDTIKARGMNKMLAKRMKVYCTKSKPNCNACPMKADCKHFASASASARLALPGPQEKSIAMSTTPRTADRNSEIVINPLPSLSLTGVHSNTSHCVPIIEEPATPEEEQPELAVRDIEDAFFYDDLDEIPSINLNFSADLNKYMQSNMELQTDDMSKALVTLHPAAASITAP